MTPSTFLAESSSTSPLAFALLVVDGGDAFAGQAAGGPHPAEGALMEAIARHAGDARIGCFAADEHLAHACGQRLRALGYAGQVGWVAHGRPQDLGDYGTLLHPGPALDRLAWRRLGLGERRYSLCGLLHGGADHAAMSAIANLLVAPLKSWDALVCGSRAARDVVRHVLERQAEYLAARFGAQRFELPQLPLIPLGVDTASFEVDPARRADVRARMGIADGDVVFLYLGRLSCLAKAHPQQMFGALERAAGETKVALHLMLCAPLDDDASLAAFREAAAALSPSVRLHLVDGREAGNRIDARAAADVFTSLADNLRESFGLTPLEAMAAGLPCVVSDWDGYRDTVRVGVDGYRIPTVMPAAGAGLDLAQRYDDGVDAFDTYCGHTSQAVALDGAALAQAYSRLAQDARLRGELGANARRRARAEYDWAVVFARYRDLWCELAERRRADPALGPAAAFALPQAVPDRLDPFDLFASYPSARITPASLVELVGDASLAQVRACRELAINSFATASLPTLEDFGLIFGSIGSRPMQVDELLDALGPCDRPTLLRGLAWLCKMDLLRIVPPETTLE
jgi:glycosyltransferase involved in cell wall biosynthesis